MFIRYGNKINHMLIEWLCDDVSDLSQIPKFRIGATAYVIHSNDTYVMDSEHTWYPITSDASPIKCNCVEESTIWNEIPENI